VLLGGFERAGKRWGCWSFNLLVGSLVAVGVVYCFMGWLLGRRIACVLFSCSVLEYCLWFVCLFVVETLCAMIKCTGLEEQF
jgi:hypothetical protein